MQDKQNEEAKWDDIDWGEVEPDPSAVPSPPEPQSVVVNVPPKAGEAVAGRKSGQLSEAKAEPPRPVIPEVMAPNAPAKDPQLSRAVDPPASPVQPPRLPGPIPQPPRRHSVDLGALVKQAAASMPKPPIMPPPPVPPPNRNEYRPQPVPPPQAKSPAAPPSSFVYAPSSEATLTLAQRDGHEELVVTVRDQFTVGRHASNDLTIMDLYVSSRHARFVCLPDGTYEVVDLRSSGGTFVNGKRIESAALKSGDELRFATVAGVFRYVAGPRIEGEFENQCTMIRPVSGSPHKMPSAHPPQKLAALIMADGTKTLLPPTGKVTIGRGRDNDIVINEPHVSNSHATVVGSGGVFEIFDLKSTSGTCVNDEPVTSKVLASGDRIQFGAVECLFEIV